MDIDKADRLNIELRYSELDVDDVQSLTGDFAYSPIEIDALHKELKVEGTYGGDLEVDYVSPGFSTIDIKSRFTAVELGIDPKATFTIEAETSFSDLDQPHGWIEYSKRIRQRNKGEYVGKVGKSPKSSIRIDTDFGDVDIEKSEP